MFLLLLYTLAHANLGPPPGYTMEPCTPAVCVDEPSATCKHMPDEKKPCKHLTRDGYVLRCVQNTPALDGSVTEIYCQEDGSGTRCGSRGLAVVLVPLLLLGVRRRVVRPL